jgi:hypothetical protein
MDKPKRARILLEARAMSAGFSLTDFNFNYLRSSAVRMN